MAAAAAAAAAAGSEPALSEDLRRLLKKKRELENELTTIEQRIYNLESSYIQDTASIGNVIRGWDGYLSSRTVGQIKHVTRKVRDSDRIFTHSSVSGFTNNNKVAEEEFDGEYSTARGGPRRKKRATLDGGWTGGDDSDEDFA
eukprot:a513369_22.p2 GENE.a513369_22~~a513369_22.p2  ORF type:complete len:152 (+),score=79.09 a513369_22:30-458(+)